MGTNRYPHAIERFRVKVEVPDDPSGCWIWTGGVNTWEYGQIRMDGKYVLVHRLSYSLFKGPIPEGLTLDHLCRTTRCVNPFHLEPVTSGENTRRMFRDTGGHYNKKKTHCKRGHEFADENTYLVPGGRACRQCQQATSRRHYLKRREARLSA